MNDRFSRRTAAQKFTLLQQFPRCKRTQQKSVTSALGSSVVFAARCMNGGFDVGVEFHACLQALLLSQCR
jgi:hypothetical protein